MRTAPLIPVFVVASEFGFCPRVAASVIEARHANLYAIVNSCLQCLAVAKERVRIRKNAVRRIVANDRNALFRGIDQSHNVSQIGGKQPYWLSGQPSAQRTHSLDLATKMVRVKVCEQNS